MTLLTGAVALTLVMTRPAWLPTSLPDLGVGAPQQAPATQGGQDQGAHCYAKLTLRNLPTPHEVLLRLGETPLTTRPVPTGVRLELIAQASAHATERVVVPADANWVEVTEGERTLAIDVPLKPAAEPAWPAAEPARVGGVGPEGRIHVTSTPAVEIWLVAGAGDDDHAVVTVPCDETAHILVVDPTAPGDPYRLSVAPKLLETAARNGGAELPVAR